MTDAGNRVVPNDELTDDDRSALGWAVSIHHPIGEALIERARSGGPGVRADELASIRYDWDRAGTPVPERHVHRTSVAFADGTKVIGVTFLTDDPYTRDEEPSIGLYLDQRWDPPWPHTHVDWPDFGLPSDVVAVRSALTGILDRARNGALVEIGCLGGHGRTGTALACLAILTGTPVSEAVAWVRDNYCDRAVETDDQARFVAGFGA